MDSSRRNMIELIKEINRYETQLLKRYQTLTELSAVPTTTALVTSPDAEQTQRTVADPDQASYNALRIGVESEALVKMCQDILSLSRQMKEMWIFGKLNTLREGGQEDGKAEEDARVVRGLMERMIRQELV